MKKTLGPLPQPQPQAEAQATAPLSYPVRVHNAVSRAQFPPMASATEYALFNAVVLDFVP
ncbi:hypothetical protein I5M90_10415 [Serratia marcescens]|nr:hypothetical protein [Serratia marcescens]MBH3071994.1 hypothetical protein [Serratia marcescens]